MEPNNPVIQQSDIPFGEMVKASTANTWISIPRPSPHARVRLFCFPYAGGSAFEFRAWSRCLPPEVEVCAVQLPGREARWRETPYSQVRPLIEALSQAMLPFWDKPFALFGHSLGAFIGFELARELRRKDYPQPAHLFVSGSRAPQLPDPDPPVHHLPDREMVDEINRRYGGIPQEILENAEMLEMLLPAIRADFTINDTYAYTHEPPFDFPIACYGGDHDHSTPRGDLESWRRQTTGAFSMKMFAGGHFFIRPAREPLLRDLAERLAFSEEMSEAMNSKT